MVATARVRQWYNSVVRLLTHRKLWRAFPELDGFDEDDSRVLYHAAKGGVVQRALRLLVQTLMAVAGSVLGLLALLLIYLGVLALDDRISPNMEHVFTALLPTCGVGGAALGFLVTRDLQIEACVAGHLRQGAVCGSCRYSLAGLPTLKDAAGADASPRSVACPECGWIHIFSAAHYAHLLHNEARSRKPKPEHAYFLP